MNETKWVIFFTNSGVAVVIGLLVFLSNLSKIRHLEKCVFFEGGIIGQAPCYTNADIFFVFAGLLTLVLGVIGCYYSLREIYGKKKK